MLDFDVISTLIGIFGGTGVLVAGVAYGVSSWKKGGNTYKEELIKDLKDTIVQRDSVITQLNQDKTDLIASHQIQINGLVKDIATLTAQLNEQGKKLKTYSDILENRDPQTREILEEIKGEMIRMNEHQVIQEKNVEEVAVKVKEVAAKVKEVAVKAETVRTDLKAKK